MNLEQIETEINTKWDLFDSESCPLVKEKLTHDVMRLLSQLPENEVCLK